MVDHYPSMFRSGSQNTAQDRVADPIPLLGLPPADASGGYRSILGHGSPDWPWILPEVFAFNLVPTPIRGIVGARATRDGMVEARPGILRERMRVEVIGFWRGRFALHEALRVDSSAQFYRYLDGLDGKLPVRYVLDRGQVQRSNEEVIIHGEWPVRWRFHSPRVIELFCAFLNERLLDRGLEALAGRLRARTPKHGLRTRRYREYRFALEFAEDALSPFLSPEERRILERAQARIDLFDS